MKTGYRQVLWGVVGLAGLVTAVTYFVSPNLTMSLVGVTIALATLTLGYTVWGFRGTLVWILLVLFSLFSIAFAVALGTLDPRTQRPTVGDWVGGSLIGFSLLFVASAALWILAVESQRRPPSKNFLEAIRRFLKRRTPTFALWQVNNGKLTQVRRADPDTTEPPHVIIPTDYAIVFENSAGKFTHAEFGPREVVAQPNDALEQSIVVNTRPRFKRQSIARPITKDGVILDRVDFLIYYQLKTDPYQYRTENNSYPISQDTLTRAVYAVTLGEDDQHKPVTNWEEALQEITKNHFRAELAGVNLLDLFQDGTPQAPLSKIANTVRERVNNWVDSWGCIVTGLEVTHVALPPHLQKKLEDKWLAERSIEIRTNEGKAEGSKIKEIEQAKAEAWKETWEKMRALFGEGPEAQLLASQYIQILQYFDSLVQMAQSPSTTLVAPLQELQTLLRSFETRWAKVASQTQPQPPETHQRDFEGEEKVKPKIIGASDPASDADDKTTNTGQEDRATG